jgi:hypothetical protein
LFCAGAGLYLANGCRGGSSPSAWGVGSGGPTYDPAAAALAATRIDALLAAV